LAGMCTTLSLMLNVGGRGSLPLDTLRRVNVCFFVVVVVVGMFTLIDNFVCLFTTSCHCYLYYNHLLFYNVKSRMNCLEVFVVIDLHLYGEGLFDNC
jgi:hypothetical protein